MKISPMTQIYIGAIVAVLTALSKGSVSLPLGIPPEWGAYFVSWDNFVLTVYNYAAPVMLAFTSSQPGPLAPPDPPAVIAAQRVADLAPTASQPVVQAAKTDAINAIKDH